MPPCPIISINRKSPTAPVSSSFDADSEGEEGRYYVWTAGELDSLLGRESEFFKACYNVTSKGNWEGGKNILFSTGDLPTVAAKMNLTMEQAREKLKADKNILLNVRSKRMAPGLDDKVLTSWNALAVTGLVRAYRAFNDERYLVMALQAGRFISGKMMDRNFRLNRNYKNGKADINGFLEDYAYTISAFIELYQVTFDESWLERSRGLTNYVLNHFRDERTGLFFFTSDEDPKIITRKIDIVDNVMPSANAVMARNLFLLGAFYFDDSYKKLSRNMLLSVLPQVNDHPAYYTTWFELLLFNQYEFYEVAIVGKDYMQLLKKLLNYYLPNMVMAGGAAEGSLELLRDRLQEGTTWIYVCKDRMCRLPVREVDQALPMLTP